MTLIWTADGFSPFHLPLSSSHPLLREIIPTQPPLSPGLVCYIAGPQGKRKCIYIIKNCSAFVSGKPFSLWPQLSPSCIWDTAILCGAGPGKGEKLRCSSRLRVLVWEVLDRTVVCWLLWVFFFRIILKQKEKLENIRNYDGITWKCDPGLTSNQDVCPVCLQIFEEIQLQFGSLWRASFNVCPWYIQRIAYSSASRSSKIFFQVVGFQLLNAWVVLCCIKAILTPPGSVFPLAWSSGWLLLLRALVNNTAEHWSVQKWPWKQVLLALFIDFSSCLLCCSPLILAADYRSPPTNLFIDSETPTSLQIHWTPPDGRVQHYKISYNPVSDTSAQQTVSLQLLCGWHGDKFTPRGISAHSSRVYQDSWFAGLQNKPLPLTCWMLFCEEDLQASLWLRYLCPSKLLIMQLFPLPDMG